MFISAQLLNDIKLNHIRQRQIQRKGTKKLTVNTQANGLFRRLAFDRRLTRVVASIISCDVRYVKLRYRRTLYFHISPACNSNSTPDLFK